MGCIKRLLHVVKLACHGLVGRVVAVWRSCCVVKCSWMQFSWVLVVLGGVGAVGVFVLKEGGWSVGVLLVNGEGWVI